MRVAKSVSRRDMLAMKYSEPIGFFGAAAFIATAILSVVWIVRWTRPDLTVPIGVPISAVLTTVLGFILLAIFFSCTRTDVCDFYDTSNTYDSGYYVGARTAFSNFNRLEGQMRVLGLDVIDGLLHLMILVGNHEPSNDEMRMAHERIKVMNELVEEQKRMKQESRAKAIGERGDLDRVAAYFDGMKELT